MECVIETKASTILQFLEGRKNPEGAGAQLSDHHQGSRRSDESAEGDQAIYRSWRILCTGKQGYAPRYRSEWLGKIAEACVRRRVEFCYQQFDASRSLGSKCGKNCWRRLGSTTR